MRHELAGAARGTDDGASLDSGIGGSRSPAHLKCLHAHVAFALARPGYELGEQILDDVVEPWPSDRCCSADLRERQSRALPIARSRKRRLCRGLRTYAVWESSSLRDRVRRPRALDSSGRPRTGTSRRCRGTPRSRNACACSSTRSRPSSADGWEGRIRFASSRTSTREPTRGRGKLLRAGDARLAAHAVRRRRGGVPPVRARCGGLRAVTMLESNRAVRHQPGAAVATASPVHY